MDDRPVTRYALAPDGVSIAYHVTGDGPINLAFFPGFSYPFDLLREDPGFNRFAKRLARFSRTVWYEGRGMGASGGSSRDLWVDENADADITAVLDTLGSEQVVLSGCGPSGSRAINYAAGHPDQVKALVLIDTFGYYVQGDDCPWGAPPETLESLRDIARATWGTGGTVDLLAPSKSDDERFRALIARCERLGQPPDEVAASLAISFRRDVRHLLATICVPTLVLHRQGDRFIRVGAGRYLAQHIPGAKYVELPGDDYLFFVGDTDALLDEIEEFLTGTRQAPEGDVVTATVLFTDIVSSTEQSARMGHRKWTKLTDDHDAMVRATLARYRGREVKTTGDGFLATFDATTRAVRAAIEIVTQAKAMGIEVRAGVHTGEIELRPDDVVGLTVSIAKRICDLAGPGEVFVSEAVKPQLVGSGITVFDRGTHVLKGVPGEWRLFGVQG